MNYLPNTKLGRVKRGRINGDPVGSEKPRGKDRSEQRGRYDPGWTPTETKIRDGLMRQFCKNKEGERTDAYRASPVWCACGRGMNRRGVNGKTVACWRCEPDAEVAK